jgi:hypothetical protein
MSVNELSTMINAASNGNSEDEGFKWRQKSNVESHLVSSLHLIFKHPSPAFTAHQCGLLLPTPCRCMEVSNLQNVKECRSPQSQLRNLRLYRRRSQLPSLPPSL